MRLCYLLPIITLILFSSSCKEKEVSPKELAQNIVDEYSKYQSISYDIDYRIKFFSSIDDTNKINARIDLIKEDSDSVFGGHVWIEAEDSIARYYDTEYLYLISHKEQKITRYTKDKPFVITGNIIGEAIRVYFLNPDRLLNGVNDSTIKTEVKPALLEGSKVWKWNYNFADEGDHSNGSKQIWIDRENLSVHKMTYYSTFQKETQYNLWNIKDLEFNKIKKQELVSRLEKLKQNYTLEDYKEMTKEERAPLANGTLIPNLKGELYPSKDSVSFEKYKGKIMLLDFWYMDCFPCIQALPHLNKLYKKYSSQGLVVLGINPFDNSEKGMKRFPNFLENNEISYPILFSDRESMKNFKVRAYPTLYLIDKEGKVIHSSIGFGEELPPSIDSLIQINL